MTPPPLKWHGGKHYLAARIVALMPPRAKNPGKPATNDPGWLHYVEPYFGGGAVLLANDLSGISEIANDLNGDLTNFWRVLQDPVTFSRFRRAVEAIPFSEPEFDGALLPGRGGVLDAVAFFVRCRMSLAGRMKAFSGITRTRTRRGMNGEVSAWLASVDGLPEVHARMRCVLILNRPALDVIKKHDGPRTLFYLDPPYLSETRAAPEVYEREMSYEDHFDLLATLRDTRGRVMLSGYRSDLYDHELRGWVRHEFEMPNHAAGGDTKRRMVECVWCNFTRGEPE